MGVSHSSNDRSSPKSKSSQGGSSRHYRRTHSLGKNRRQHKIMIDETEEEFVKRMTGTLEDEYRIYTECAPKPHLTFEEWLES